MTYDQIAMRTTLEIDDDVLEAAQRLAEREDRTPGEVISELARKSLPKGETPRFEMRNGFPLIPGGKPVTAELVERLKADE